MPWMHGRPSHSLPSHLNPCTYSTRIRNIPFQDRAKEYAPIADGTQREKRSGQTSLMPRSAVRNPPIFAVGTRNPLRAPKALVLMGLPSRRQYYPFIKTIRLRGSDTRCAPTAHPIPRRSRRSPRYRRPPCPMRRSPHGHGSSTLRDRGPGWPGGPGPG